MSAAVEAVLNQTTLTDFTVDVVITNTNNQSFSYSPLWLKKISIKQNFAGDFADKVFIEFSAAPADYISIFNNTQGLVVSLRFVYLNPQTLQRVFTPAPIFKTYNALLLDPQDILKKYTTGTLMPTVDMPQVEQHVSAQIPVKLALMESDVYRIRQQKYAGTKKKATVADVISYITAQYQIKTLYVVPPDNKMAFDHIIVPPYQSFDEIFDFLQFHYGVYMKGMDWYYTGSILYVYPAYENNPIIKYNADIYNAPNGNYSGVLSYHASNPASNNIGIVSTTPVDTTDVSRPSAEDHGNSFSFMRASSVIDKAVTNNAQGTFINNNRSLTVGTTIDRMTTPNANNPQYTKTTDNIFYENSKLAKWSTTLIKCGWKKAVPFSLFPGHNIKYHFDKNGIFTFQQGILEGVSYEFERSQKLGTGYTYTGNATLAIRAESDVTS